MPFPMMDFEMDPKWFIKQVKLARGARPSGARLRRNQERVLLGYVDGVVILVFPRFQASVTSPGTGHGWCSLNPNPLADVLKTFDQTVRLSLAEDYLAVGRLRRSHESFSLQPGRDEPAIADLAARLDEIAAEQCYAQLVADTNRAARLEANLTWHRAADARNTAPILEHVRDGSLIVYRRPDQEPHEMELRALVDKKQLVGNKVVLMCHDFRGKEITVDPRWVTSVGC